MSVSIDDVISAAKPVERVVKLCVAGELVAEYEKLKDELDNLGRVRTLSGGRDAELRARLVELEGEMKARTFEFRFRALSAKAWSDLMAKHPDKGGKRLFNLETFPVAAIAACCVEPAGMDDPDKVAALMDKLSSAQQNDLLDGAWEANTAAPKGMSFYSESAAHLGSARSSASAATEGSPAASS